MHTHFHPVVTSFTIILLLNQKSLTFKRRTFETAVARADRSLFKWGRVCNLQCNRWLVRSLSTNNHTLPSHLRLCSLFVASYGSQGLRWKYSNPPPHGVPLHCLLMKKKRVVPVMQPRYGPHREHRFKPLFCCRVLISCDITWRLLNHFRATNVLAEPFLSKGCFSGSTVHGLRKYCRVFSATKSGFLTHSLRGVSHCLQGNATFTTCLHPHFPIHNGVCLWRCVIQASR
jgi:hypothetical protein